MKNIHLEKNQKCEYNSQKGNITSVEFVKLAKNDCKSKKAINTKIVFILKGSIILRYNLFSNLQIEEGNLFLLPTESDFKITAQDDSNLIIYHLDTHTRISQNYFFDRLIGINTPIHPKKEITLPIKKRIQKHLELQEDIMEDGIECKCLLELRKKELFYLLKVYYTKEELHQLFSPILSKDISFMSLVSNHFMLAKNIQELAKLCNYSLSGFIKRFHKTFEVSPYKWIKEQKANRILYELKSSDKSFKEICYEYGFGSLSYFHAFCKREFGTTPKKIRNISSDSME